MNCFVCKAEITSRRGDYGYSESGLVGVVLMGVEIRECSCGESSAVIPRVTALHRAIAQHLVHERRLLTGSEVRFLRTLLDWDLESLARHVGVSTHSLVMWEQGASRLSFGPADRLIRLFVCNRINEALDVFDVFSSINASGPALQLKAWFLDNQWAVT